MTSDGFVSQSKRALGIIDTNELQLGFAVTKTQLLYNIHIVYMNYIHVCAKLVDIKTIIL